MYFANNNVSLQKFIPFMQVFLRYIYTILLSLLCFDGVRADNLRVSLLTCSPGTDAYAHFGHTAIRITNMDTMEDVVYNYGCFDYNSNMFVYKFIKGETDYILGAEPAKLFFYRYRVYGIEVMEQVLNLSQNDAENIHELLEENLKPENMEYRYNYLYDNCTTWARDAIERAITDDIIYKKNPIKLTARQELHESLQNAPWLRFGIDLVLGEKLDDKNFDKRQQMFIPAHYANELDSAYIVLEDGTEAPLVSYKQIILDANPEMAEKAPFITPTLLFSLLFIGIFVVSIFDFTKKKVTYGFDIAISLFQGLAGIIVSFLYFFSEHPTVDSNWFVIILNPLYLLYAIYLTYCMRKNKENRFAAVNMAVCGIFFMLIFVIKQDIQAEAIIMASTLLLRAISVHIIEYRNNRKKN